MKYFFQTIICTLAISSGVVAQTYNSNSQKIQVISETEKVDSLEKEIQSKIQNAREEKRIQSPENNSIVDRYKQGDKTVVGELITVLEGEDEKLKSRTLRELSNVYRAPETYNITEPELIKCIYEGLNDPELEYSAIRISKYMKLPNYEQRLEEHLISGKSNEVPHLFSTLGDIGTSLESIKYIEPKILDESIDLRRNHLIAEGLKNYYKNGNEEIRKYVLNLALRIYREDIIDDSAFEEMKGGGYSSNNPAHDIIEILLSSNDERVIPIALEFYGVDIELGSTLEFLVRAKGEEYQDLVFETLKGEDYEKALYPSILLYEKTQNQALVKEILIQLEKQDSYTFILDDVVSTIIMMDATHFFDEIDTLLSDEYLIEEIMETYTLMSGSVEEVAKDLQNMGIIEQPLSQNIIDSARKLDEYNKSGRYPSFTTYVNSLLTVSGIYTMFFGEADVYPVNYDYLIPLITKNSNEKFPDYKVFTEAYEENEDLIEQRIYILANDKVYIAHPKDHGNWYDAETAISLLNRVLEDTSLKERFVLIDSGGSHVFFGPEKAVNKFTNVYGF